MKAIFLQLLTFFIFSSSFAADYYYYFGQKINLDKRSDRIAIVTNTGAYSKTYIVNQIKSLLYSGDSIIYTDNFYLIIFKPDNSFSRIQSYMESYSRRPDIVKFTTYTYYGESRKVTQIPTDEFIVRLRRAEDKSRLEILNAQNGVHIIGPISDEKGFLLKTNDGISRNALELSDIYFNEGFFEYAEPNFLIPAKGFFNWTPNDPIYSVQWPLNNTGQSITTAGDIAYGDLSSNNGIPDADMDVDKAWNIVKGNNSVIIGVFDTGVDSLHPDLTQNLITGYNAYTNVNSVRIDTGDHGTCTMGIIGARSNNSTGVSGICGGDNSANSNCKMMSFRLIDNAGNFTSNANIGRAFDTARVRGIHVSSNSWGGGSPNTTLTNAINNCANNGRSGKGTVILFSSGNDGRNPPNYPSYLSTVICVGASTANDQSKNTGTGNQFWWGGNYGEDANGDLDCVAPTICPTTDKRGTMGYSSTDYEYNFNGTSCACPNAAGVAGLIFCVNPNFTSAQVKDYLFRGCNKIDNISYNYSKTYGKWNPYYGYGRVNAYNSVQLASGIDVTPPTIVHNNVYSDSSTYPTKINTIIRDQDGSGVPITGANQPKIIYRWNKNNAGWSNFDSAFARVITGDSSFQFQIPCVGRQTEIQYFIRAYDNTGNMTTFPRLANPSYIYTLCYFAIGNLGIISDKLTAWTATDGYYSTSPTVTFASFKILNTWVKINLRHTWMADEEFIYIWSPLSDANNNRKQLYAYNYTTAGATTGITGATVTDSASKFWKDGTQPYSNGFFKPEYYLRGYNGNDASGGWKFTNLDVATPDVPNFDSIRISFLKMSGVVSPSARLDFEADSICDFGNVFIGNTYTKDFYLKNVGNSVLNINSTSISGTSAADFSLLSSPSSVNAGDSGKFTIQMIPTSKKSIAGNYGSNTDNVERALLNINNNDPSKSTFRVSLQVGSSSPVELISFASSVIKRDVKLNWITANELNNKGFEIYRKSQATDWTNIGFVQGAGNSNQKRYYAFNDNKLNVGKYNYRIKQVDLNGNFRFYDLPNDVDVTLPKNFSISQNYPNPFNPVTKIDFDVPYDSYVSIKIFDITGREMKTLLNEKRTAGYYTLDFNSNNLSSGVYFYRMIADKFSEVKRMLLVK
jgi:hypothetical protein